MPSPIAKTPRGLDILPSRGHNPLTVRDALVTIGLSLGLATLVTAYASIVYGLVWRPPRWRALVAFIFPMIGPYWAFREGMPLRALSFIAGATVYAVAAWDAYRRQ